MAWQHIESGQIDTLPLDLYRRDDDFMIRADGLELMNSRWHRSERALAEVARPLISEKAQILIGGLGIGFTLAGFRTEFPSAHLTVVEKSPDVLKWYAKYFHDHFFPDVDTQHVSFLNEDVQESLKQSYDLIVLDVDNGPEPLSCTSNQSLYNLEGLKRFHSALRPSGALLIWSGFLSETFQKTAEDAEFTVHSVSVNVGYENHNHFIYICKR